MSKKVGSITTELVFIDSLTIAILGLIAAPLIQNILLNPPEEELLNSLRFEKIAIVLYLSSLIGTISLFIAGIALTLYIRSYYLKGIPISKELLGWDIALTVNSTIGVTFLLFTLLNFIEPNSIIGLNQNLENVEHGKCTECLVNVLNSTFVNVLNSTFGLIIEKSSIENLFTESIGMVIFSLTLIATSIYSILVILISHGWRNIYKYAFIDDNIEQIRKREWAKWGLSLLVFYILWFVFIAHCQNNIVLWKAFVMLSTLLMYPFYVLFDVVRHFYSGKDSKTSAADIDKLYSMHKDVYEKLKNNNLDENSAVCYFKRVINIRNDIKNNNYINYINYIIAIDYNYKKLAIDYNYKKPENQNNKEPGKIMLFYSCIRIKVSRNDIKIYQCKDKDNKCKDNKCIFDIEFRFIEALDGIRINYKLYPPINPKRAIISVLGYLLNIFLFIGLYIWLP